jgi:rod shape determining protein RodA
MFKNRESLARFRLFNPLMLMSMVCLAIMGVLYIYSSCSVREDADIQQLYIRHAEALVLGLFLYGVAAFLNYRRLLAWSWLAYGVILVLLILVPIMGDSQMGAKRWISGDHPVFLDRRVVHGWNRCGRLGFWISAQGSRA